MKANKESANVPTEQSETGEVIVAARQLAKLCKIDKGEAVGSDAEVMRAYDAALAVLPGLGDPTPRTVKDIRSAFQYGCNDAVLEAHPVAVGPDGVIVDGHLRALLAYARPSGDAPPTITVDGGTGHAQTWYSDHGQRQVPGIIRACRALLAHAGTGTVDSKTGAVLHGGKLAAIARVRRELAMDVVRVNKANKALIQNAAKCANESDADVKALIEAIKGNPTTDAAEQAATNAAKDAAIGAIVTPEILQAAVALVDLCAIAATKDASARKIANKAVALALSGQVPTTTTGTEVEELDEMI